MSSVNFNAVDSVMSNGLPLDAVFHGSVLVWSKELNGLDISSDWPGLVVSDKTVSYGTNPINGNREISFRFTESAGVAVLPFQVEVWFKQDEPGRTWLEGLTVQAASAGTNTFRANIVYTSMIKSPTALAGVDITWAFRLLDSGKVSQWFTVSGGNHWPPTW